MMKTMFGFGRLSPGRATKTAPRQCQGTCGSRLDKSTARDRALLRHCRSSSSKLPRVDLAHGADRKATTAACSELGQATECMRGCQRPITMPTRPHCGFGIGLLCRCFFLRFRWGAVYQGTQQVPGLRCAIVFEDYSLDTDRRELRRGRQLIAAEPQIFDLLQYLIRNRERVVSKDDLLAAVWDGRIVSESALSTRHSTPSAHAIGDTGEEQRLIKTVPRKGIRFVGAVREEEGSGSLGSDASLRPSRPTLAMPDKPSIAVLAFTNMSGDPGQEYFSDGITEDIITGLSRFSELFVIARNSSFQYKGKSPDIRQVGRELGVRYVLEGSIRRAGDRVRISAQLIDAVTGAHRWADRYDRELKDVFAVQDEVSRAIVAILVAHVNKAEAERTLLKPPATWHAHDLLMRASDIYSGVLSSVNVADLHEARRLLERSIALDPNYARAYAMLAHIHLTAWLYPLDEDSLNPAALERALRLARKAVRLDPNLPRAHATVGIVLTFIKASKSSL